MKILHTSDWHLGQHFMMKSREAEHFAFLNWLIELVDLQNVDALIVAGDIFDTASPPSYARKLYSDFIVKLQNTACQQLIIVSGNHDSVAVLNESKILLQTLNVSVLAGLSAELNDHIINLTDKNNQQMSICALPFLRATDVMSSEAGSSASQKQMNLQQGIAQAYQDIYQLAKLQKTESDHAIIATGHLTAVGCSVSESVRDIYIGTLTAFPASLFPEFDYIALGHLHRAQKVQKSERIRYSGSPIALSFDESKHPKSVVIVEFEQQDQLNTSEVIIPNFQQLQVIKGDLATVESELTQLISAGQSVWVEVKIEESFYRSDVQAKLNELVENSPIEILKISAPRIDENSQWQAEQVETLDALTPIELFQHRLDVEENLSESQQTQLKTLFAQSVAELEQKS
ncbi:MAG: exonuclease subunit SbcD [Psychromonas sp.]|nr:exonuclease subunit SbcD [Alteromonadales bacterium]MCP5079914.1 exonuclease subunit SbcD [Psychromonas sp.]